MTDLSQLDWVTLNDIAWRSRRLLQSRWSAQWPYEPERAARVAIGIAEQVYAVAPGFCPHVVLELVAQLLVYYLNGANTLLAVDVEENLHDPEQAAVACYDLVVHALAFPDRYLLPGAGCSSEVLRQRALRLPLDALKAADLRALLSCDAARFAYASLDMATTLLPESSIDLLYSSAVLEHIHDPRSALLWHRHLLKPEGFAAHVVGLDDHRHYENPETFTSWSFMVDGQYGDACTLRPDLWINGLRPSQWQELVKETGFESLSWQLERAYPTPDDVALRVRSEFRSLPESDLRNFVLRTVLRPVSVEASQYFV